MVPIVLHHGFMGYDQLRLGKLRFSYFHKIDKAIGALGHRLIVSRVHPTASIQTRAQQLKQCILGALENAGPDVQPVVIVAHSLGGLDARYMISKLGMADHVSALLTVTSPHRGSGYADWVVKHLDDRFGLLRAMCLAGIDLGAARDLTTEQCNRFNEEVSDAPGVRYYSIQCARASEQMPIFAFHSHKIIRELEGDNDGLVSVRSSRWGISLGEWDSDHWQSINRQLTLRHHNADISPRYVKALQAVLGEAIEQRTVSAR